MRTSSIKQRQNNQYDGEIHFLEQQISKIKICHKLIDLHSANTQITDFPFIFKNRFNKHINFPLATINNWNSKTSFFARAFWPVTVSLTLSGMCIYIAKRRHCMLVGNHFSQTSHSVEGSHNRYSHRKQALLRAPLAVPGRTFQGSGW